MEIHTLYPEDLEQFLSEHTETDYQIVDVRQPQEYETGHIPGAKLLPLSELEGRLDELAENRDLIFYCRSGKRSSMETAHARAIYRFLSKTREMEAFETYFANLSGDLVEGGWDLEAVLERLRKKNGNTCLFLSEMALELEYRAYDLYRTLADTASDPEQQQALFFLSEQEKAHVRLLTRGLPGFF